MYNVLDNDVSENDGAVWALNRSYFISVACRSNKYRSCAPWSTLSSISIDRLLKYSKRCSNNLKTGPTHALLRLAHDLRIAGLSPKIATRDEFSSVIEWWWFANRVLAANERIAILNIHMHTQLGMRSLMRAMFLMALGLSIRNALLHVQSVETCFIEQLIMSWRWWAKYS